MSMMIIKDASGAAAASEKVTAAVVEGLIDELLSNGFVSRSARSLM
jgi:hypothetical protein